MSPLLLLLLLVIPPTSPQITLSTILSHNLDSHFYPPTLRLPLPPPSDLLPPLPLFQLAPLLLLPTRLSPLHRAHFYTSTVAFFLWDGDSRDAVITHLQNGTANRRWDRVVLIGKEMHLLHPLVSRLLLNYRLGSGYSLNTRKVWVQPHPFNEHNLNLVPLKGLDGLPSNPNRMGFNLRGRHFRVAGCEFPPWTLKIRGPEEGQERVWGTHYEMVAFAATKFNFTFETTVLDGPNYGELHPNGTWTGMYAMIYYGSHDFCFMLGHDNSWSSWVDYASTFGTIDLIFATAWPARDLKWTAVFEPLQPGVWLLAGVTFLVLSLCLFLFQKVKLTPQTKAPSIQRAFLATYSLILEQGVEDEAAFSKPLLLLWLLFTLILGTGYKSTLKSRLTFPSPEVLPSNFKQLAGREDFRIILNAQGVVEKMFFATTTVPEMVNIRERMGMEPDTARCVEAAFLRPHHACIGWFPYFKQTASARLTLFQSLEPLSYTKQAAHFNSLSMAFQKDSAFVDGFIPITGMLFETGAYARWEEEVGNYYKELGRNRVVGVGKEKNSSQVYEKLVVLSKLGENVAKALKRENVWVVFVVLVVGWGVGGVVMGMEVCFVRGRWRDEA